MSGNSLLFSGYKGTVTHIPPERNVLVSFVRTNKQDTNIDEFLESKWNNENGYE